jgi:hypothetical protein
LGSSAMLKFELERGLGVRSINLLKIAAEAETLRLRALLAARRGALPSVPVPLFSRSSSSHSPRLRVGRHCTSMSQPSWRHSFSLASIS